jgi:signal peptidase I
MHPEGALEFRKSQIREYFESIVITAIIALFATTFVVQAFKIPTGSMESNLLIGDHLLVNKYIYGLNSGFLSKLLPYREPRRGDVIVFKYPEKPEVAYVKRLIGMPGDKIEMIGRTIYVNGQALSEKYTQYIDPESVQSHYGPYYVLKFNDKVEKIDSVTYVNGQVLNEKLAEPFPYSNKFDNTPFYVPQNQYFAMGDNRDNSQDSRFWGSVPRDYILGKALVIYWSFETPRNEYLQTSVPDRLKQFADVFVNFFSKTRWSRTFKIIR